ncbi:hypothetical protein GF359_03645 [candidate division WOR-3 bacterium]|uniref:Cobalamin-independent methionine synthase MetE N-terminal domain-containing protein n=1 Tax=candidate division WOR-3 bacterium TaxID=2052148 RepID=A0A9D5QC90_UNCW3|nr:hypothetical protein [candidate division WOR-3 bacterium]MBD3364289.1 hypothetical protein [candidate division WOR-3 bacterium]
MNILIPGQYPRSEKLVAATRDFDRRRITDEELEAVRKEDAEDFMQKQTGFAYMSTGNLAWQDHLRPYADIITGCKVTGLKRFFETNTFWKVLEPSSETPAVDESKLDEWVERYFLAGGMYTPDSALVFTMPFLYLFKRYSRNIEYAQITEILDTVARRLMTLPEKMLVIFEPSVGFTELTDEERKLGRDFLAKISTYSNTPVILATAFFDVTSELEFLYTLPVSGFGIDFYANPVEKILQGFPMGKLLMTGAVATDSTHVEEADKLRDFFNSVTWHIDRSQVFASFAGPAELLPREAADAKLDVLKEVMS